MAEHRRRIALARYAAPFAFLVAVTVAVLLIRAGLDDAGGARRSTTTPAFTDSVTAPPRGKRYYRIRGGDTLGGIAARFDTSVRDLLALNPKLAPNSLTIGQRLRVR